MKKKLPIPQSWYQGSRWMGAGAVALIAFAYLTLYLISVHPIVVPAPVPLVTPTPACEKKVAELRGEVAWRDRLIVELKRQAALDKQRWAAEQKSLRE
jgi:hypothetical protein